MPAVCRLLVQVDLTNARPRLIIKDAKRVLDMINDDDSDGDESDDSIDYDPNDSDDNSEDFTAENDSDVENDSIDTVVHRVAPDVKGIQSDVFDSNITTIDY